MILIETEREICAVGAVLVWYVLTINLSVGDQYIIYLTDWYCNENRRSSELEHGTSGHR